MPLHEHFREYTADDLAKIKREACIKHECPYLTTIGDHNPIKVKDPNKESYVINKCCNYILITGHMRNCMPDECKHYKDKNIKKRKHFDPII